MSVQLTYRHPNMLTVFKEGQPIFIKDWGISSTQLEVTCRAFTVPQYEGHIFAAASMDELLDAVIMAVALGVYDV
jgi:hypothetical protein